MGKIEWAPLLITPRRRIQTLTVGIYIFVLFALGLFSHFICGLTFLFGNTYVKVLLVVYVAWIYSDRERARYCIRGPGVRWMRDNFFWKHFREYFPIELVKTAELPPNKNYILACFPHGVISIGAFCNMCSDISKWNELFPKIRVHVATLAMHFHTPIWREIIKSWGMISVARKSLLNNLTTSNDPTHPVNNDGYTSTAVAILVGGTEEALNAKPGTCILTIKNRKGFIKVAMQSGAAIVPVFAFGENELYNQLDNPPDSRLRKFQTYVKEKTTMPPLIIMGRGILQYTFGMLPFRRRLVQVVGAPIYVPQCEDPKEEDIEKYHKLFIDSLQELFEKHKSEYMQNANEVVLEFK